MDSNGCLHQDKLEKDILTKSPYDIAKITDKVMGISFESTHNRFDLCQARRNFMASTQFKFSIGLFSCERYGSHGKLHAAFRMEKRDGTTSN